MNELIVKENKQLEGLEPSKAQQIKATFEPMVKMLEEFEEAYAQVMSMEITEAVCAKAKRLRLDIAQVRIKAEKERKKIKEEYVRGGKAIDGVANILKFAVVDKEEKLKDVELHFERLEEEKKKRLQAEREIELLNYESDGSGIDLGSMDDTVWNNYLTGVKATYKAVKDAEAKAEKDRIKAEKKAKVYRERREFLLPLSEFVVLSDLTEDTTQKQFKEMLDAGILKKDIEKLYAKRIGEIAVYSSFIDVAEVTRQMAEEDYLELLNSGKNAKRSYDQKQDEIRAENEKLRREKEAREEKERKEKEEREAREKEEAEEPSTFFVLSSGCR